MSNKLGAQVIANYTASQSDGCSPLSVLFTNTSTGATSYSWDLGNGNTSTIESPGATYSAPGVYSVVLTAINGASTNTYTASITVFADPTPDFTTTPLPTCVGQDVGFTDNSIAGSGTIANWAWDFGDGTSYSTVTGFTTHAFAAGGTYPVTLTITNSDGCSNSIVKSVTITDGPFADFTGTPSSGCTPPTIVSFTNTSTTTGPATYEWDFGDGTQSTASDPSNTYNFTGAFTVTLAVIQQGCSDTTIKSDYIFIQDIVPDFIADLTNVCAGDSVTFTDLSAPLSTSRTWDFGDGGTDTAANPVHSYAAAGVYTVSLLDATALGCTHSEIKNNYITVNPVPIVSFTVDQRTGCTAPFTANFTDNSVNAVSWAWDFGDGITSTLENPSHIYAAPGAYTVTLVVTSADGCQTTLAQTDYVFIADPVANFIITPQEGCTPLSVNFQGAPGETLDPITNYAWDFGNGTGAGASPTTSNLYVGLGCYSSKLVITTSLGCKDSLTKVDSICVGTPPTANFSVAVFLVCHGDDVQFNDLSTGADSLFWEFDVSQGNYGTPYTGDPVYHLFPDTGTFFVRQIAYNNGCPDTFQIDPSVRILPPKPIFSYQLNCINPNSVTFTDASQGADSIVWDFLDGSPVVINDLNPTHVYPSTGSMGVQLTVFNFATGCSETITQPFTIADPNANYSSTSDVGCYALPVTFTNLSIEEDSVAWDFGDGTAISNDTNSFVHIYADPGRYIVTLSVTDVNGCIDSTKGEVIVYGPVPNFNADVLAGCTPLSVDFTDASVSDSTITSWLWDFGDGSPPQTTTAPTIKHDYTVSGLYTVTMDATDKNGCVKSITKTDYIEATFPAAVIVADTFACRLVGVLFDATTATYEMPATFDWDFGDGNVGTGVSPTHFFNNDSIYTVSLTVTDKNNCVSTAQHQIRIEGPLAAFTHSVITQGCGLANIQFTDLSSGVGITTWDWNFGDGGISPQQHPIHVYTSPGYYSVSLTVTNLAGCPATFIFDSLLVLGPSGSFSFTPDRGCVPLEVTFTAVSTNTINYLWDFGDGAVITTTDKVVTHLYTQVDTATPFLLLENFLPDGSSCKFPAPPAGNIIVTTMVAATVDSVTHNICFGDSLGVIYTSTTGGTPPYNYSWSSNPVQTTAMATNLPAGSYTVTVTDSNSCQIPATAIVTEPSAIITTTSLNDTVCPGTPAVLSATAVGGAGNHYFTWQPLGITNSGTLNLTPTTDSIFEVTAYDSINCAGTIDTVAAIVYSLDTNNIQVVSRSPICPGESSDISVQTSGAVGPLNYIWDNNLGTGPGVHTVTPFVPTTYIVTISNICGVVYVDSVDVLFNPPPTVIVTSDTNALCVAGYLQFRDSSLTGNVDDPIVSWLWSFGDGTTSNEQHPNHLYTLSGYFPVSLTVTTVGGCTNNSAASPLMITAYPFPIASFSIGSTTIELPFEETKTTNQSVGGTSYYWDFGDGFFSTEPEPTHLYSSVGKFRITMITTAPNGCKDTAYIDVVTDADLIFPNVFTPNKNSSRSGGRYDANSLDNDIFFPYTSGVVEYLLQIFNRWGELVFESRHVAIGWDGYYKEKLAPQDVYVWKAYVKFNNGEVFNKSGDVTLLK